MRPGLCGGSHAVGFPVRGDAQDRRRVRQLGGKPLPALCEDVVLKRVHRAAMTDEQHRHRCRMWQVLEISQWRAHAGPLRRWMTRHRLTSSVSTVSGTTKYSMTWL